MGQMLLLSGKCFNAKDFEGFLLRSDHQITESHKQNDNKIGFLYGFKNLKNKLVLG